MDSEIINTFNMTEAKAQYDACAKRLLSEKHVLSHILVKTVEEFKGMNPNDVIEKIEGEPYIGSVPVEPGLTNKAEGDRVVGFNTEDSEINEGLVRFDIVFYVRTNDELSQIIINLEAQKDEPKEYNLLNRAIYYVARLVSSQKERDFAHSDYDKIKQVYSIWICMNMSENSMSHYHLTREQIVGVYEWPGKIDLLNIVMIGLAEELPKQCEELELHRLLAALLSNDLNAKAKAKIVSEEYDIPVKSDIEGGADIMCNLGQGIEDRALAKGIEQGRVQGIEQGRAEGEKSGAAKEKQNILKKMRENGLSDELIAKIIN
jgi:hypothetical protein